MRRIRAILPLLALAATGCGAVRRLDETVARQSGEIAVLDYRIAEIRSLVGAAERTSTGTFDEVLSVREVYGAASPDTSGQCPVATRETVRRRRSVTSSSEAEYVSGAAVAEASAAGSAVAAASEEGSVSRPVAKEGGQRGWLTKARRLLARLGLSAAATLLAVLVISAVARRSNGVRRLFKGIFINKEN